MIILFVLLQCPFCAIIAGDEDAIVVGEWPDAIAFFPKEPATIGHTLVVPRVHIADIWGVSSSLGHKLSDNVLEMAHRLRKALSLVGMNVINSAGSVASQTVDHLHVHLVPRYQDDTMGNIWPEFSRVSTAEITLAASLIRSQDQHRKE